MKGKKEIHRVVTGILFMVFCVFLTVAGVAKTDTPDFVVSGLSVQGDGFLYVKLQNKSPVDVPVTAMQKEKIFLVIFVNNLKRAEYKVKYIDLKLFKKQSTIMFRTNFRVPDNLRVTVEVNGLKIFPETNYNNNRLTQQFHRRK